MFTDFATGAPVTMACPACGPVPAGAVIVECTTHYGVALRGLDFVEASVNAGMLPAQAIDIEADVAAAEAQIIALIDEGKIDEAGLLAEALTAQIAAAHGFAPEAD